MRCSRASTARADRASQGDIAGITVWTVRNADGSIYGSYWLSDEEHGPAMRAGQ